MQGGVYTFHAQGQIYHFLEQLIPRDDGAKFLQLYFYDSEHEIDRWLERSKYPDKRLIQKLMGLLSGNPNVQAFQKLGDIPN